MRWRLIAVGKLKNEEKLLARRYLDRLGKSVEVVEVASAGPGGKKTKSREAEAIRKILGSRPFWALDESGELLSTRELADSMERHALSGRGPLTIVIGGTEGLEKALLKEAGKKLAFGRNTWPHGLVRVMVLEQLYRVFTMRYGHPYNRV